MPLQPTEPMLVRAYIVAMRATGALCLGTAAAVAALLGPGLAAPLLAVGIVTLLAAQGLAGRWLVGSAICIGASLGELAFGGMLFSLDAAMWQWALPLALVALMTSGILVDRSVREWLEPRIARFEVVSSA